MQGRGRFCAVVPFKGTAQVKQRLAAALTPPQRQALALAMLGDVLQTLSAVDELRGVLLVTTDPEAITLAAQFGAEVSSDHAHEGHTGAVMGAASQLAAEGVGLMTVPGDIPLVAPDDIRELLDAHAPAAGFTIAPAHDELGSNAVLCTPANAAPLRFGDNSFFPHLAAARAHGIEPRVVRLPRIALDIDTPQDLTQFLLTPSQTRSRALLDRWGVRAACQERATA
ncbi:MAG: 2-phospho-L-lactate guanylyltransferase [Xanthobacteraceae bacterium]